MAQNNESLPLNTPAMEYCMEQIKQSGKPGSEVVIGAMALWIAAHGDFELPNTNPEITEALEVATETNIDPIDQSLSYMKTIAVANRHENHFYTQPRDVIHEINQTSALNYEVQEIFADLIGSFKAQIPQKSKVNIGTGEKRWPFEQTINDKVYRYAFKTNYKRSRKQNTLTDISMRFGKETVTKNRGDYRIGLEIEGDKITKMRLERTSRNLGAREEFELRKIMAQHSAVPTGKLVGISAGYRFGEWYNDMLGGDLFVGRQQHELGTLLAIHELQLGNDRVYFESAAYYSKKGEDPVLGGDRMYTHPLVNVHRTYDGETNSLKLSKTDRKNGQVETREEGMDPSAITTFARAIAGLIPTRKIEL
jgi:hypothetical protein